MTPSDRALLLHAMRAGAHRAAHRAALIIAGATVAALAAIATATAIACRLLTITP
ncbi:MAG: hypothetical protein LBC18_15375 [Opitutaceae bacterium]|jgi:hypothetical protein|nr:hypothetical protein [Opitutaceae bacterium]